MIELIIIGILYTCSFIGITILVLQDKDPNILATLMVAASTAILGYVNHPGKEKDTADHAR
jgi:hypothetical protein